jgi:hypothetical protein
MLKNASKCYTNDGEMREDASAGTGDKLCGRSEPDVLAPRHLSLRDPVVNLTFCTRPSGEGSVLSGKTCFFHARGAGNETNLVRLLLYCESSHVVHLVTPSESYCVLTSFSYFGHRTRWYRTLGLTALQVISPESE